ncbi:hypothetical protein HK096_001314, partial [Nowakowskiella sp. JEL0078]
IVYDLYASTRGGGLIDQLAKSKISEEVYNKVLETHDKSPAFGAEGGIDPGIENNEREEENEYYQITSAASLNDSESDEIMEIPETVTTVPAPNLLQRPPTTKQKKSKYSKNQSQLQQIQAISTENVKAEKAEREAREWKEDQKGEACLVLAAQQQADEVQHIERQEDKKDEEMRAFMLALFQVKVVKYSLPFHIVFLSFLLLLLANHL